MFKKLVSIFIVVALISNVFTIVWADEKVQPVYHLSWSLKDDDSEPPVNTDCKITFSNDVVIQPSNQFCFLMWNGNLETSDVVLINNNRSLVRMEVLQKYLGDSVSLNKDINLITIKKDDLTIVLNIDSLTAKVNGVEKTLDVAPTAKDDITYLPIRFIGETLGFEVGYVNNYPFYNYPLVWVETLNPQEKDKQTISKETALVNLKNQLNVHLEKYLKENKDGYTEEALKKQKINKLEAFGKITYVGEFSRYWVCSNGYDDETYSILLIDRYTGEMFYARGLVTSYWIGNLDYEDFYSMYCVG